MANPIAQNSHLKVHVYHLSPAPVHYQSSTALSFSPSAFTLISGHHSAILVDVPTTRAQGEALAEWISNTIPGKKLKGIYVTHGHGDHFFAARSAIEKYPETRVIATEGCYQHMLQQYEDTTFGSFWDGLFPGEIDGEALKEEVDILPEDGKFELEGQEMRAVEVGQGDTHSSTVLHVPSLDLVVGGDVVYGHCHQLFAEDHTHELRAKWLESLDTVAALKPKIVVPSHMRREEGYGPEHIEQTKGYIQAYEEVLKDAYSWEVLEKVMKERFPGRDGNFILRWSCQAPFGAAF